MVPNTTFHSNGSGNLKSTAEESTSDDEGGQTSSAPTSSKRKAGGGSRKKNKGGDGDGDDDDADMEGGGALTKKEVRRRSSKACDNCRKSKCKCTRDVDPETKVPAGACQNCIAVGAECTFLGASRKRGPPKGYIEAIESRLHRMEALMGGLLQSEDPRAQTLLYEVIGNEDAIDILKKDLRSASAAGPNRKSWKLPVSPGLDEALSSALASSSQNNINGVVPQHLGAATPAIGSSNSRRRRGPQQPQSFSTEKLVNATSSESMEKMGSSSSIGPLSVPSGNAISAWAGDTVDPGYPAPLSAGTDWAGDSFMNPQPPWKLPTGSSPDLLNHGSPHSLGGGASLNGPSPASSGVGAAVNAFNADSPSALAAIRDGGSPQNLFGSESSSSTRQRQRRRLNNQHATPPGASGSAAGGGVADPASPSGRKGTEALYGPEPPLVGSIPHTGAAIYNLSQDAQEMFAHSPPPDVGSPSPGPGMNELADVVGQLSLNENAEVRYHGRSSGLYLISKSTRYKDFFWNFPSAGFWPPSEGKVIMSETEVLEKADAKDILPDRAMQDHLMDLYMTYVHPHFPLLYKTHIMQQYRNAVVGNSNNVNTIPVMLKLAMFSVSSRYSDLDPPRKDGKFWTAGDEYFAAAKRILNQEYASTKLVTVQTMLLMAYRQIGTGAMSESWIYVGMAIRMAQDLGLFRDVDKWFMPVSKFSHEEKQTRKRVWWACIVLDKYVSTYIGRPLAIFERDYDTSQPIEDEPDEHEQWRPIRPDGTRWDDPPKVEPDEDEDLKPRPPYPPQKTHAISCFNASGRLAALVSKIIANFYAIKTRVIGQASGPLLSYHDQHLAQWFIDLPPHLSFNPSSRKVPPPHVLCLHAQFYCALILLHRPFIPGANLPRAPSSFPSHSICTTSANAISNIVSVFRRTFSLRQCPPFMTYPIFTAAIMHVYNTTYDPSIAKTAKVNLQKCQDALHAMQMTWTSAMRQWELLYDLVDLRDQPSLPRDMPPVGDQENPRGKKRSAEDESDEPFERRTTFHTRAPHKRTSTSNMSRHRRSDASRTRDSITLPQQHSPTSFVPDGGFTYQPPPMAPSLNSSSTPNNFMSAMNIPSSMPPTPTIPDSRPSGSTTFDILGINLPAGLDNPAGGQQQASWADILNSLGGGSANAQSPSQSHGSGPGALFQENPFEGGAFSGFPLSAGLTDEWGTYLSQAFNANIFGANNTSPPQDFTANSSGNQSHPPNSAQPPPP